MTTSTDTGLGRYVYAFVRAADAESITKTELQGLFETPVDSETFGQLAAITSPIEAEVIRPRRKLLAAHQNVVAAISKDWDMLPVSFGLVAADERELSDMAENHADQLLEALDRVSGQVEMNLVMRWSAEDVFGYLVSHHTELQQARDLIASGQASRDEMIEMGRLFENIRNAARDSQGQRVQDALGAVCREIELQDPKTDQEIVRVSCLIPRDAEQAFEAAVYDLASGYDEDYAFAFNGPWPPYSFVNLKLTAE